LPARRKFRKSDAATSAQVSRLLTQPAPAHPETWFALTSAAASVLQCPPAASPREPLYQLYGDRTDLIDVMKAAGGLRLSGFVAALAEQGPTRGPQHVFINRRIVKDRTIAHAIIDSYSQASIKERSPEVHLFIEMPPEAVDVNVHPTKAEVRFRDQSLVHEVVRRGLMEALGQSAVPQLQLRPDVSMQSPMAAAIPGILGGGAFPNRWMPQSGQGRLPYGGPFNPEATPHQTTDVRPMIPLGQFRDTFIVAIDDEGIAIIDQHVAHERVLFERVMEKLTAGRLEAQRLLVPLVLELSP